MLPEQGKIRFCRSKKVTSQQQLKRIACFFASVVLPLVTQEIMPSKSVLCRPAYVYSYNHIQKIKIVNVYFIHMYVMYCNLIHELPFDVFHFISQCQKCSKLGELTHMRQGSIFP